MNVVPVTDVRHWPGMRSEYSWQPARPGGDAGRTGPHQIGVSFSGHHRAVYATAGRTMETDIAPGTVFVTGPAPIHWTRVREAAEALEVYLDAELLAPDAPVLEAAAARDGVALAICSRLRQVHVTGDDLSDIEANTLAHRLAAYLRERHAGSCARTPGPGLLDRRTIDRVASYVEDQLHQPLTLDRLARVAALSPYHFARSFKASTGMAPHQFVTHRRMARAKELLLGSTLSVRLIADAIGMSNLSHFRRVFRRHHGATPGDLRHATRPAMTIFTGPADPYRRDK